MKIITSIIVTFLFVQICFAQDKFFTKTGYVSFFSHSLVEDIKADNNQVLSIIDISSGEIVIQVLMRSFLFKKALMREHFNENYVESHKFPKAIFKGHIENFESSNDKETETEIKGIITVHGKEKKISIIAKVNQSSNEIILTGDFMLKVADFDIKIPIVVVNNIAKNIKVTFELHHKPYSP